MEIYNCITVQYLFIRSGFAHHNKHKVETLDSAKRIKYQNMEFDYPKTKEETLCFLKTLANLNMVGLITCKTEKWTYRLFRNSVGLFNGFQYNNSNQGNHIYYISCEEFLDILEIDGLWKDKVKSVSQTALIRKQNINKV